MRYPCADHLLAFGIFARSLPNTPEFSSLINSASGLELADSITGDGHKMLNVVGVYFPFIFTLKLIVPAIRLRLLPYSLVTTSLFNLSKSKRSISLLRPFIHCLTSE
jgi:hypothetical protein